MPIPNRPAWDDGATGDMVSSDIYTHESGDFAIGVEIWKTEQDERIGNAELMVRSEGEDGDGEGATYVTLKSLSKPLDSDQEMVDETMRLMDLGEAMSKMLELV